MTILSIILLVLAAWLIFTFNVLVGLRNQVANAFRQIDVQLKRRHDLIPNLVESVKGEMKFERETLERVIQARAAAMSASDGYSIALKNAGAGVLKLLNAGDTKGAQAAARRLLPFGLLAGR